MAGMSEGSRDGAIQVSLSTTSERMRFSAKAEYKARSLLVLLGWLGPRRMTEAVDAAASQMSAFRRRAWSTVSALITTVVIFSAANFVSYKYISKNLIWTLERTYHIILQSLGGRDDKEAGVLDNTSGRQYRVL